MKPFRITHDTFNQMDMRKDILKLEEDIGKVQPERFDELNEKLAENSSEVENLKKMNSKFMRAEQIGIFPNMPDKEVEYSLLLQDFLMVNANNYTILFDQGDYYLSNIDVAFTKDTIISMRGVALGGAIQDMKTIIKTRGKDFIRDGSTSRNIQIVADDMHFMSEGQSGICFSSSAASEFNFHFNDVYLGKFDIGFKVFQWSCGGSGGKDITIYDNRTGMILGESSHLFYAEGLNLNHNRLGIDFKKGGNNASLRGVHIATGYAGADRDSFTEFIGIKTNGSLIIEGLYMEDYIGGGTYQAYKQIGIDYVYTGYQLPPLILNGVDIKHAEGTQSDKTLRFKQIKADGTTDRFYTDKLIMNNLQTFTPTAFVLDSASEQLGILINGENIYSRNGIALFNRKEYEISKTDYTLTKGFGITVDGISVNRMQFGSTADMVKQSETFYNTRLNKDALPFQHESIQLAYATTYEVDLDLKIFTATNDTSFKDVYLTDYTTLIKKVKAVRTAYGYEIKGKHWLIASTNNGIQMFHICLPSTSGLWGSALDYKIKFKQFGQDRNS